MLFEIVRQRVIPRIQNIIIKLRILINLGGRPQGTVERSEGTFCPDLTFLVTPPARKPPGPGVKERKVRAKGAFAALNGALGLAAKVYEDAKFYNDVLNAWYNAAPAF